MNATTILVSFRSLVYVCVLASQLVFAAAPSWNVEQSFFPPNWAKHLPYRGELHIQFSPDFGKTNTSGFWSYLITYKLNGNVLSEQAELEKTLKDYDFGLYAGAVPESAVTVILSRGSATGQHGGDRYTGTLVGFDSFFTKQPLTSQLQVSRWYCPDSDRTFVTIARSPARRTNEIWKELSSRQQATACHRPISSRTNSLQASIAAVENGIEGPNGRTTLVRRMAERQVPALSLAVIDQGQLAWAKAYGQADVQGALPATTNTLFQAASISKSIAAAMALRLFQSGQLPLDGEISPLLNSTPLANSWAANDPITVRRILSHTAGFNRSATTTYDPGQPLPSALDSLLGRPPSRDEALKLEFKPGSRWGYSGGGFIVLQLLMENATSQPFDLLARREIFTPLRMTNSTFANLLPGDRHLPLATGYKTNSPLPTKWQMHPDQAAAGLWSTASDLALFLCALGRSYAGEDETWLRSELSRQLWSSQFKNSGLGFFLSGSGRYFSVNHDGANAGYRSLMIYYPKLGLGAVALTNADEGNELILELFAAVGREYAWPD